jgi:carbon storage regulator
VLVISRRPGEILMIGEGVEVEILESSHSQVKLGIRAPKQVTILRKEIRVTEEQNRLAAQQVSTSELEKLLGRLS